MSVWLVCAIIAYYSPKYLYNLSKTFNMVEKVDLKDIYKEN